MLFFEILIWCDKLWHQCLSFLYFGNISTLVRSQCQIIITDHMHFMQCLHFLRAITVLFIFLCAALCSVAQLCPNLCDLMHWSPPGFCVHGIFQAKMLVWHAIPYSRGSSQYRNWSPVSPALAGGFFTTGKPIHFLLGFLYLCGFPVLWYIMLLLDFPLMSTLLFLWLKSYDSLVFGSS